MKYYTTCSGSAKQFVFSIYNLQYDENTETDNMV